MCTTCEKLDGIKGKEICENPHFNSRQVRSDFQMSYATQIKFGQAENKLQTEAVRDNGNVQDNTKQV